ncbi:MAG: hypothetical protein LBR74_04775 [Eubacterium sp.]|nr:hypothetical protein [Eubacterium sp.]
MSKIYVPKGAKTEYAAETELGGCNSFVIAPKACDCNGDYAINSKNLTYMKLYLFGREGYTRIRHELDSGRKG